MHGVCLAHQSFMAHTSLIDAWKAQLPLQNRRELPTYPLDRTHPHEEAARYGRLTLRREEPPGLT